MGGAKTPVDFAAIRYLEGAMTVCRALPLVAMLVAVPLHQAAAQFGGMPGMPGSPPQGGMSPFGGPPAGPPPQCQQILALRDETEKHGKAIQAANEKKASTQVACRLFKTFLASEAKFMKALEDGARPCGVPPEAIKSVKDGHTRASQIGKQVCEAAAQPARPAGPSLSDALGSNPVVPDNAKPGGAFDTLSGNALSR
jgi:hypothetical protein